jgi:hypothetical protein
LIWWLYEFKKSHPISAPGQKRIAEALSGYDTYAEADSFYTAEAEEVELTLVEFRFIGDEEEFEFSLVQSGPNVLAAEIVLDASIKAEATFYMSIYDSIDKDYTPAGSTTASTEEEVTLKVLATFERETSEDTFDVAKVEIVEGPRLIRFGVVEPDYEPEPEENYEIPDIPRNTFNDEMPI